MNEQTRLTTVDSNSYQAIEDEFEETRIPFLHELKHVVKASGILSASFFLQYFISVMAIYSAGRLGAQELAAAQLAVSTFNITGNAFYQGTATSLDSFCPQAFGKRKYHDVGKYVQRCATIIVTMTIPLAFLWWNAGAVIGLVVADKELVAQCQLYLRIIILGAPGLALFEIGKRFLLCQHLVNPITYVLLLVSPINLVANYFLVWHPKYGYGFIGVPITVVLSFWLLPLFIFIYSYFSTAKQCWGGLDTKACFSNWSPMLKLAVPGIIMIEAEYLAFQVLNFFAASISTIALAAQSICSTIGSLVFQILFSVSVLVGTRVSHLIGCRDFHGARNVVKIAAILAVVVGTTVFLTVFFGRFYLAKVFSKDDELLRQASRLLILLALNNFADAWNVIMAGVLRGQGRQRIGLVLNIIAYYFVALPLGYYLAFHRNLEVFGLWCGLLFGVLLLATSEVYFVLRSDWSAIARELEKA